MSTHYIYEGVFPGDRPMKAVSRFTIYACFIQVMGITAFRRMSHLVLGGDGNDVALLLRLGVTIQNIVIVDYNKDVCNRLQQRYPKALVMPLEVMKAAEILAKRKFGTINLDFCSNLSPKLVHTCVGVLRLLLQPRGAFSVVFRADRENQVGPRAALKRAEESAPDFDKRIHRSIALSIMLGDNHVPLGPLKFLGYHSEGQTLRGGKQRTSMAILVGGGHSIPDIWEAERYCRVEAIEKGWLASMMRSGGVSAKQVKAVLGDKKGGGNASMIRAHCEPHTKADGAALQKRRESLKLTIEVLAGMAKISDGGLKGLEIGLRPTREKAAWLRLQAALAKVEGKLRDDKPKPNGHVEAALDKKFVVTAGGLKTIFKIVREIEKLTGPEKKLILEQLSN